MYSEQSNSRIALTMSSFRPGGGERVMVDLAKWFVDRGYSVDLVVLKSVGNYAEQVDKRVRIVSLDAGRIMFSLPKLVRYLRREQPRVLMATDEYTHLLAIMARAIGRVDTRIVLRIGNMFSTLHGKYEKLGARKIIPFLSRLLYSKADGVIANSQGVARDVEVACGVPRRKIVVIGNPKDLEYLEEMARKPVDHPWLSSGHEIPVVVWFGRLREQKDIPTLFSAISLLNHDKKISVRLIVIGDGRERPRLEAVVQELKLQDQVSFIGYQDNPHAYVARADAYVLTSLWEGLPNALIEAIACGVPVVAVDCDSGPREILAPDSNIFMRRKQDVEWAKFGVLVPVRGVKEIVEALTRLLRDPELAVKYRKAALHRARDFDAHKIVDAYERALFCKI